MTESTEQETLAKMRTLLALERKEKRLFVSSISSSGNERIP